MMIEEIISDCQRDSRQTDTKRLTANDLNKVCYSPWELCGMGSCCRKGFHEKGGCANGCHILKMYKKLAMYEDLEEQGRLLKPPCAVGDAVYRIFPNDLEDRVLRQTVLGFSNDAMMLYNDLTWTSFDKIGKTVFLTIEEAEAALKEIDG